MMKPAIYYVIQGGFYVGSEHFYPSVRAVTSVTKNRHGKIVRLNGRNLETNRPWSANPDSVMTRRFMTQAHADDVAKRIKTQHRVRYDEHEKLRVHFQSLQRQLERDVECIAAEHGVILEDDSHIHDKD